MEVARLKGMVRAAEAMNTSQPAVSRTISELETILQVQLLDRSHRRLSLTPEGRDFYRLVSGGVEKIGEAVDAISSDHRGKELVSFGVLPTFESRYLIGIVEQFKAQSKNSTLRMLRGTNAELLDKLRAGDIDFVVGRMAGGEAMRGMAFEHLYSEPIICVVRPNHPLLEGVVGDLRRVVEFGVMLHQQGTIPRAEIDRIFMAEGIMDLADVIETDSVEFAREYLLHSDSVWIIPQGVVLSQLEKGELVKLAGIRFETLGPVGLTTLSERELGRPILQLIDMIKAAIQTNSISK